jgi:hydrocephalus-inducing protein
LTLAFKGKSLGPTFKFDIDSLDFGLVSYGFAHSRTFNLVNTSEIPFRYRIKPPAAPNKPQEFELSPETAVIIPFEKQKITVDFTAYSVKMYEVFLTVDIEGVGSNLLSLPVRADSRSPTVSGCFWIDSWFHLKLNYLFQLILSSTVLDFGDCFINHNYEQQIQIQNETDLPARFEIIPQDEFSQALAHISTPTPKGVVPANRDLPFAISFTPARLGPVNMVVHIRVAGSEVPPMELR